MFVRTLLRSFGRQKRRKAIAILSVALGLAVATTLFTVSLEVGDRVAREMRSYGANLVVLPLSDAQGDGAASLRESDLPRVKTVFWKNNILALAPFLPASVTVGGREVVLAGTWFSREVAVPDDDPWRTGVRDLMPWWHVEGRWPEDSAQGGCLLGAALARDLGLGAGGMLKGDCRGRAFEIPVDGVVTAGGAAAPPAIPPLARVQALLGAEGRVKRVLVSALTTPDNELAKKAGRSEKLTDAEAERFFCTPFVAVVADQLREAIPGSDVRPIRQITEAEGSVVTKLSLLMYFLAGASLLASALGVTSTMTSAVIERRKEIGLLKAIGAGDHGVVALLLVEAAIIGLLGGVVGYALGSGMAFLVGKSAFGVAATARGVLLPIVVVIAVVTTVLGSAWPVRRALGIAPAVVLHEE